MPKRKPIDYKAQFVPGIFRDPTEVEGELEALDENGSPTDEPTPRPDEMAAGEPRAADEVKRSNERKKVPVSQVRLNTRHSFDVWQDQLHALTDIQSQRFTATGKKPKMGDLVKEALDDYIRKAQKWSNERTNG